jgi:hypothetical protein
VPSVSVFGCILRRGRTRLIIYDIRLNSLGFRYIFGQAVVPFIKLIHFADHHTLHKDNAPCQSSRSSRNYLTANNINHFKTSAQSPDLNPIELVWHDLKNYISNEVKPNRIDQLRRVIVNF